MGANIQIDTSWQNYEHVTTTFWTLCIFDISALKPTAVIILTYVQSTISRRRQDSTPVKPLLAAKKAIINWRNVSPPIAAKKPRIYWFNLDTCLPPHARAQRKKQRRVENPHSVVSHEKKRHNSFLLSLLFIILI